MPKVVWILAAVLVLGATVVSLRRQETRSSPSRLGAAAGGALVAGMFVVIVATAAHVSIPTSIWLAMPFLLALVALAGAGRRSSSMPSALAIPYVRGEG